MLQPFAFVGTPQVDIAEAEGAPPAVQHLPIEAQDAFARYAFRRRSKRGEAVIEAWAIGIADAREQVPKCESGIFPRVNEEDAEQSIAFRRRLRLEVESRQSVPKRCGRIFHVRRARANFRPCLADCSGGNERFVAVELEADPAHGGAQKAGAGVVYVQRGDAPEVHSDGGRGIHGGLTRPGPDDGVNGATFESERYADWAARDQNQDRNQG